MSKRMFIKRSEYGALVMREDAYRRENIRLRDEIRELKNIRRGTRGKVDVDFFFTVGEVPHKETMTLDYHKKFMGGVTLGGYEVESIQNFNDVVRIVADKFDGVREGVKYRKKSIDSFRVVSVSEPYDLEDYEEEAAYSWRIGLDDD
jgi:hypothetical protein